MIITVMYQNGDIGSVDADELDSLIQSNRVKKFLRAEGWCTIGSDQIRKERRVHYKGPERRAKRKEPIEKDSGNTR